MPKNSTEYSRLWRARNKAIYGHPLGAGGAERASEYRKKHYRERLKKSPKYRDTRYEVHIKYTYGLSSEEYHRMLREQAGECGLCYQQKQNLAVDHCHDTGAVRGLLCNLCNTAVGYIERKDGWMDRAEAYLNKTRK